MQPTYTRYSIHSLLIISLSLLGLSLLLGAGVNNVHAIFNFYQLANVIPKTGQSILAGVAFLVTALFIILSLKKSRFQTPAFVSLITLAVIPLVTLLSESRWMTDLGGFPIIGSGQGIIKYTALISLAIYLYKPQRLSAQGMVILNFFPVALVLIWIGGMKFYEFEANGIISLVSTSIFMSWLYTLFSVFHIDSGIFELLDIINGEQLVFFDTFRNQRINFFFERNQLSCHCSVQHDHCRSNRPGSQRGRQYRALSFQGSARRNGSLADLGSKNRWRYSGGD